MTLVREQEQWVCHDVSYRTGTMGISWHCSQDRNNGYVMPFVEGQEQWACHYVDYRTGTMAIVSATDYCSMKI